MKLATQISILVVAGLAFQGISQNGMESGRLYKSRCECCGKPRLETSQRMFSSEPVPDSDESFREATQEFGLPSEKTGLPRLPKPVAVDGLPSTMAGSPAEPMLQDILEIRRQMGGSSIASILDSDPETSDSGVSNAIAFEHAIREYAEKTNFEQVNEKTESHFNENQGSVSSGDGLSGSDIIRRLGRFRF